MPRLSILPAALAFAGTIASGQMANQMTQEQLSTLTARGVVLGIGGPGLGFTGELTLAPNGRGQGQVTIDGGETIPLDGAWSVRDGQLCRTWSAAGDGAEICEIWVLTSGRSVDVYVDGEKVGVNTW